MADVAPPAAPAAPSAGVQTSAPPTARNTNGQFSPKDGAQTRPPVDVKPGVPAVAPPPEKKPEAYRFKRKIDNEDVDLDEGGLENVWKELKFRRSRQAEVDAGKKEIADLLKLAQSGDDEAVMRKLGLDPDAIAARRYERAQKLAAMSPQERELEEARLALENDKKTVQSEKERLAEQVREANRARAQAANRTEYEAALGHSVLPHSRAKLFLMTQIQRGQKEAGAPKFTPEQLGKAYDSMMLDAFGEMVSSASTKPEALARFEKLPEIAIASLGKLDGGDLLARIGPELEQKILRASVARLRGQQTISTRSNGVTPPAPPPNGRGFDEVEAEQRKKDFLASFR